MRYVLARIRKYMTSTKEIPFYWHLQTVFLAVVIGVAIGQVFAPECGIAAQQAAKPAVEVEVEKPDEKWLAEYGQFLAKRDQVNALKQRTGIAEAEAKVLALRQQHPEVAKAEADMVELATALRQKFPDGKEFDAGKMGFVKVAPAVAKQ